ncbi:predicted protein [Arabidopsis lyrata subsp. lyrata]|uniref:Predicted protein n=1 Tax=Arabidopsis lyrata subsp. lyrata TaxID=81972 RepID=D7LET4_ARALL|nr:predicted protein [Arabidopsis lyrata subsp. lyrata]
MPFGFRHFSLSPSDLVSTRSKRAEEAAAFFASQSAVVFRKTKKAKAVHNSVAVESRCRITIPDSSNSETTGTIGEGTTPVDVSYSQAEFEIFQERMYPILQMGKLVLLGFYPLPKSIPLLLRYLPSSDDAQTFYDMSLSVLPTLKTYHTNNILLVKNDKDLIVSQSVVSTKEDCVSVGGPKVSHMLSLIRRGYRFSKGDWRVGDASLGKLCSCDKKKNCRCNCGPDSSPPNTCTPARVPGHLPANADSKAIAKLTAKVAHLKNTYAELYVKLKADVVVELKSFLEAPSRAESVSAAVVDTLKHVSSSKPLEEEENVALPSEVKTGKPKAFSSDTGHVYGCVENCSKDVTVNPERRLQSVDPSFQPSVREDDVLSNLQVYVHLNFMNVESSSELALPFLPSTLEMHPASVTSLGAASSLRHCHNHTFQSLVEDSIETLSSKCCGLDECNDPRLAHHVSLPSDPASAKEILGTDLISEVPNQLVTAHATGGLCPGHPESVVPINYVLIEYSPVPLGELPPQLAQKYLKPMKGRTKRGMIASTRCNVNKSPKRQKQGLPGHFDYIPFHPVPQRHSANLKKQLLAYRKSFVSKRIFPSIRSCASTHSLFSICCFTALTILMAVKLHMDLILWTIWRKRGSYLAAKGIILLDSLFTQLLCSQYSNFVNAAAPSAFLWDPLVASYIEGTVEDMGHIPDAKVDIFRMDYAIHVYEEFIAQFPSEGIATISSLFSRLGTVAQVDAISTVVFRHLSIFRPLRRRLFSNFLVLDNIPVCVGNACDFQNRCLNCFILVHHQVELRVVGIYVPNMM